MIIGHRLHHKERADYGAQVIARLAEDLEVDSTALNRCVKFAEKYPKFQIVAGRQQLGWSHYRELITILDDQKRLQLEKSAHRNAWSSEELAARIRSNRSAKEDSESLTVG